MALRKEDGALLDWINQFTSRDVHNFGDDFEDPNIWISLMHGLLSQLGDYDSVSETMFTITQVFLSSQISALATMMRLMSTATGQ